MAIALVGSVGALAQAPGATTISPAFGQATTAGNLLIATVSADIATGNLANDISCSNGTWLRLGFVGDPGFDNAQAAIFGKPNCGAAETAPTFSCVGGTDMAAQLSEWSGTATANVVDQVATDVEFATPMVATAALADVVAGELQISNATWQLDAGVVSTLTDTFGSNATAIVRGTTSGTGPATQVEYCSAITTGNSVPDTDTATMSTTGLTISAYLVVVSILPFGVAPRPPAERTGRFNATELPVLGAARPGPRMF